MEEKEIVQICKKVLARLSVIGYEKLDNKREEDDKKNENSELNRQLIFPKKNGGDDRISEQELRQLFIDVFKEIYKKDDNKYYYAIETPTEANYSFGTTYKEVKVCKLENKKNDDKKVKGQSALLDMCIFNKKGEEYNRILNIEFKHQNAALKNIAKDILKLMHEEQNGTFILLLKNTDSGTLCNSNIRGKGVFNKFKESFKKFENDWSDKGETSNEKFIKLVIISLEQKTLIHQTIRRNNDLDAIFSFEDKFGDINEVEGNKGWESI